MNLVITLTYAGADTGPFDLYSDVDNFVSVFESGITKSQLTAGYTSTKVPDNTQIVRVLSTGVCTNYIDIYLNPPSPT
jgi:hypothetical protein